MNEPIPSERPMPLPLYSCRWCVAEYSWPASDMAWSEPQKAWVCAECWNSDSDGIFKDNKMPDLAAELTAAKKLVRLQGDILRDIKNNYQIQLNPKN